MNALVRRQQVGRIHAARQVLGLSEQDYRELLSGLTGEDSTTAMTDRQINHVLDWLNYLSGRRPRQPLSFDRSRASAKENLVRLLYAVCAIVPPGYERAPLLSESWQTRMTGRFERHFEAFDFEDLYKLVEGIKAIFRRQGQRDTEALTDRRHNTASKPLWGDNGGPTAAFSSPSLPLPSPDPVELHGEGGVFSEAI